MREVVGPNKVVIGGASGSKSGSQNLQKSVTFGATPTLCVPDNGFGENDMVGHQSDTSRPLSSNGESSRPSSSSRVKDLEYEEELEERRRQRSAVLQVVVVVVVVVVDVDVVVVVNKHDCPPEHRKQREATKAVGKPDQCCKAEEGGGETETAKTPPGHSIEASFYTIGRCVLEASAIKVHIAITQVIQPLPPVKEDVEGEEMADGEQEWVKGRGQGTHIADFVVHNRIWKQFGNTGMYLAVIQQLLELGDARRKSWTSWNSDDERSSSSSSGDEEEENFYQIFPFTNRLRSRKMSLSGVLDQSDAERRGFAALLQLKLERLSIEDDVESEVGETRIY